MLMLDGLVSCSLDCSLSCTSVSHTLLAQLKNVSVFVFNIAILFRSFGIQFWKTLRWLEVVLCNLIFDISRLNDFPHFIRLSRFPWHKFWTTWIYSLIALPLCSSICWGVIGSKNFTFEALWNISFVTKLLINEVKSPLVSFKPAISIHETSLFSW